MSEKEKQQATEWGVCLIRWGLLAWIVLAALLNPGDSELFSNLVVFVALYGLYNLLITILLSFHIFFVRLASSTLVLDSLLMLVLIHRSGGLASPFLFFPLLPILVGALHHGRQIAVAAATVFGLNVGLLTVLGWENTARAAQLVQPLMFVFLYLLAAAIGTLFATHLSTASSPTRSGDRTAGQAMPDNVKLIYEMAITLGATLNYEHVLEAILDISRLGFDDLGSRAGESVGLVLLYDRDGGLYPASHRNLTASGDEGRHIPGVQGMASEAITSATALIGGSPAEDAELHEFRSLANCKSMICVPLRAGFETFGAVLFASGKPHAYTQEHCELLNIFCSQATIALQNASLYQSLREERDKIVDKEEEARHKLARDLHDGPTQDVAAIAMRLNFARLLVERDPARAKAELERLEDLAHRTVKEIRSMLFTLRPIILETEGLVAALNQYADNLRESDGLAVEIDAERFQDCLDVEAQGVVFAIMEEAINNARKHAQASRILVRLSVQRDLFIGQVVDNGVGFDVKAVESSYSTRGSLGMLNLKERAELVGGTLSLESVPGQGTRVTLLIPIVDALG